MAASSKTRAWWRCPSESQQSGACHGMRQQPQQELRARRNGELAAGSKQPAGCWGM